MRSFENRSEVDRLFRTLVYNLADKKQFPTIELVEWDPTLGWFPENLPALQQFCVDMGLKLESVPGDVFAFYGTEPLLMDDEIEEGWVVVTDLHLAFT